jgi:hypothetical protein
VTMMAFARRRRLIRSIDPKPPASSSTTEPAFEFQAKTADRLRNGNVDGAAALHVERAAAVKTPFADVRSERIDRPL